MTVLSYMVIMVFVSLGGVAGIITMLTCYIEQKTAKHKIETAAGLLQENIISTLQRELYEMREKNIGDYKRDIYENKMALIDVEYGPAKPTPVVKPKTEYEIALEKIAELEEDIRRPLEEVVSEATDAVVRRYKGGIV